MRRELRDAYAAGALLAASGCLAVTLLSPLLPWYGGLAVGLAIGAAIVMGRMPAVWLLDPERKRRQAGVREDRQDHENGARRPCTACVRMRRTGGPAPAVAVVTCMANGALDLLCRHHLDFWTEHDADDYEVRLIGREPVEGKGARP